MENNYSIELIHDYVILMMQYKYTESVIKKEKIHLDKINHSRITLQKEQKIAVIESNIRQNEFLLDSINKKQELFKTFITIDEEIAQKYMDNAAAFLVLTKQNFIDKYVAIHHTGFYPPSFPLYYTYLNNVQCVKFIRKIVGAGYTIRDIHYSNYLRPFADVISENTIKEKFINRLNNLDDNFLSELIKSDNAIISITFNNDDGDLFTIHRSGIIMADNFDKKLCHKISKILNK